VAQEFIAEFDGVREDYDMTRRGQFTDKKMLNLPQQASFNS
jgi:hypothetical protein